MAHERIEDIQKGWKVFAGAEELGRVEEVGPDKLVVGKGLLVRRTYHVPAEYVDTADDGVVDLNVDRSTIEQAQSLR